MSIKLCQVSVSVLGCLLMVGVSSLKAQAETAQDPSLSAMESQPAQQNLADDSSADRLDRAIRSADTLFIYSANASIPSQVNDSQIIPTPAGVVPIPGTVSRSVATLQLSADLPQSDSSQAAIAQANPAAIAQTTPTPTDTQPTPTTPTTPTDTQPTPTTPTPPTDSQTTPSAPTTPTSPTIDPGRATRSGSSYVAVGGNIGIGGRTALGRGNFVITSKIGLTDRFSARPGIVIGRSPTILIPVAIDFPVRSVIDGRLGIAPFVGGGIAISTRGGSEVRALAMGGIDIPLSSRFTATASANAAFFRRTEIGVILGIGYNF
jgi:hypothetical protein